MTNVNSLLNVCGVYLISFTGSKRVYVGSSIDMRRRCNDHLSTLKNGKSGCHKLQLGFNKYGQDRMSITVLEYCNKEVVRERETFYIIKYDSVKSGFNITADTISPWKGHKHTVKARKLISKAGKGNTRATGSIHSPEIRIIRGKAISAAKTGKQIVKMWGEKHHRAVLTNAQAVAIRSLINVYNIKRLSEVFKCSKDTITKVVQFKTYKNAHTRNLRK